MQTFIPSDNPWECASSLDDKRLYKQVVECKQIMKAIQAKKLDFKYGWKNHPATLMWEDHEESLRQYQLIMLDEWLMRRWSTSLNRELVFDEPSWWGGDIHKSHRANLYRKDPEHYSQWVKDSEEWPGTYVWPVVKDGNR